LSRNDTADLGCLPRATPLPAARRWARRRLGGHGAASGGAPGGRGDGIEAGSWLPGKGAASAPGFLCTEIMPVIARRPRRSLESFSAATRCPPAQLRHGDELEGMMGRSRGFGGRGDRIMTTGVKGSAPAPGSRHRDHDHHRPSHLDDPSDALPRRTRCPPPDFGTATTWRAGRRSRRRV
jgi:hypothetical protein